MKIELENALAQEFPFMRRENGEPGLYGEWGCECNDGWYELLREVCAELAGITNEIKPCQIKQETRAGVNKKVEHIF